MIEVRGYGLFIRWFFRTISTLIFMMLLWGFILSVLYKEFLFSIILVLFSILPIFILYLVKRHMNKYVTKAEVDEHLFRLTLTNKKMFLLDPESVVEICHNERQYLLILDNGYRFYLPKVFWWINSIDPWKSFLTQKCFPNAEFRYDPFFW